MNSKQQAEMALQQLADEYVHFEVNGKEVKIPYVLGYGRWQFWNTSGKGTPEMIRKELTIEARFNDLDLDTASVFEIYDFMRNHKIGIDCSGLAYHLLDAYTNVLFSKSLASYLVRYPGYMGKIEKNLLQYKRFRRISAKTLTSPLNTTEIFAVKNIQIGDLIRINRERDHVLIISGIKNSEDGTISEVTYIHSSSGGTQQRGPHYGKIAILDPEKGLDEQDWLERTKRNEDYGEEYFKPELGDSVRRLKCMVLGNG